MFKSGRGRFALLCLVGTGVGVTTWYLRAEKPVDVYELAIEAGLRCQVVGDRKGAIEAYSAAIELKPNKAAAYFSRGRVLALERSNKADQGAIRDLTEALAIDPKLTEAYRLRARIYRRWELLVQSLRDLTRAIELEPRNAELYFERAETYAYDYSRGWAERALVDYSRAIEVAGDYPAARYARARVRWNLRQDFQLIVEDMNIALKDKPRFAQGHYLRYLALKALGKAELAGLDLVQAKRLDPEKYWDL